MIDFLLELGLEEIPDRYLPKLREGLRDKLLASFSAAGVKLAPESARLFGGPRRLAVRLTGLPERLPDEWKKGPPLAQAVGADGKPSPAAEGFAKKLGCTINDLKKTDDGKFLQGLQKGAELADLLPGVVSGALKALELPKAMRWGSGEHEFIRPLRWIVALRSTASGSEVVPLELFGISSGRESQGPRKPGGHPVVIPNPAGYEAALEAVGVYADFSARRAQILKLLDAQAASVSGALSPKGVAGLEDTELLDRVTDLVENPGVVLGDFDPQFLKVPNEILACAMREHQKNFAVYKQGGDELLPKFLAVIDKPADPKGFIRRGNEAVLRSRLSDAKFFHDEDLKLGLDALREKTRESNFFAGLGTLHDKSERLLMLCDWLGDELALEAPTRKALYQAAKYAKADLASNLIGEKEFNVLQGKAGGYYAAALGMDPRAVAALGAQYAVSDSTDAVVHLLGLTDRLDTLVGFFMLGKIPTGSKDPLALRRAGNQLWQLWFRAGAALPALPDLIAAAARGHANVKPEKGDWSAALEKFLAERLENYFLEQGFSKPEIRSVMGEGVPAVLREKAGPQRLAKLLESLRACRDSEDFRAVCEAATRITNILKGQPDGASFDAALLREPAERELAGLCDSVRPEVAAAQSAQEFPRAFTALARLRVPLEGYFARDSNVMVLADDPALRANRLAFLRGVQALFAGLFDPAVLAGEARK